MCVFANRTLLVTGVTDSLSVAVLRRLLPTDIGQIRVMSWYEKKG